VNEIASEREMELLRKIEALKIECNEIESRNKLLERVLEAAEGVWPYLAGHNWGDDSEFCQAIRAARGGDEKEG
jgi:SOS response regulatory protein OraA/RecX